MVYLTLYTKDITTSINFYVKKLGLFKHIGANRLCCIQYDNFILDLTEPKENSSPIKFSIFFENGLTILEQIKEKHIEHKLSHGLAGSHLSLRDPDGNMMTFITEHYAMQ